MFSSAALRNIQPCEEITEDYSMEALTWTPPVCQVSIGKKDRLQSYIRPVDGVYPLGLYGIRRRGPI